MKITIYELLGLVKEGKAPKKIKYRNITYKLEDYDYFCANCGYLFDRHNIIGILDEEVEIVKEKKLADILTPDELKCFEDVKKMVNRLSDEEVKIMLKLLFGDEYEEIMYRLRNE